MLEKLAKAGMNIARLNMSHGDHSSHKSVIDSLKILNKKLDHPVGILLDTQGPEIRTGDIANDLHLKAGDVVSIVVIVSKTTIISLIFTIRRTRFVSHD